MRKNLLSWILGSIILIMLLACGGGGGGISSSSPDPVAGDISGVINWPERSRNIDAPSSSLSSSIIIRKQVSGEEEARQTVNRPAGLSATVSPFSIPGLSMGAKTLEVQFYSEQNAAGQMVASAAKALDLNSEKVSVGTVTLNKRITRVAVESRNMLVGEEAELQFTAFDESGALVAVSKGSAVWSLESGSASLTLSKDGVARAVSQGLAMVSATIDEVASNLAQITSQNPAPSAPTLKQQIGIQTYYPGNHDPKPNAHEDPVTEWLKSLDVMASKGAEYMRLTVNYQFDTLGAFNEASGLFTHEMALYNEVLKRRLNAVKASPFKRKVVLTFQTFLNRSSPWPMTVREQERYAAFVTRMVQRILNGGFPQDSLIVQCANEPNMAQKDLPPPSVTDLEGYTRTLKALVNNFKNEGVSVPILPGSFNDSDYNVGGVSIESWINLLATAGVLNDLHGIALHTYRGTLAENGLPAVPESSYGTIDFAKSRIASNQKIMVLEAGIHRKLDDLGLDGAAYQRSAITRYMLMALIKNVTVILYEAKDQNNGCEFGGNECWRVDANEDGILDELVTSELYYGLMDQSYSLHPSGQSAAEFLTKYGSFRLQSYHQKVDAPNHHEARIKNDATGKMVRVRWSSKQAAATSDFPFLPRFDE